MRSPLDVGRLVDDSVAVVATRLTVLDREDESVDDVEEEAEGEDGSTREGVPVGAEESANGVVG